MQKQQLPCGGRCERAVHSQQHHCSAAPHLVDGMGEAGARSSASAEAATAAPGRGQGRPDTACSPVVKLRTGSHSRHPSALVQCL